MGALTRYTIPVVLSLLLAACGQQADEQSAGNRQGQADAQSASADNTGRVWIPGWKRTSVMSTKRAGSAVVVSNGVIYVIGGVDGRDFLDTVEFARIREDGSLDPWQAAPRLNEARGFTAAAVHNGAIYVVGGGNGPNGENLLRSVERAVIQGDGSLGPWQTQANAMIVPRRCSKVILKGDTLYSFGGFGGALLDTVETSRIGADGRVGPWTLEEKRMTVPRYVNSVKGVGDISYVIGGHDQSRGVGMTSVEWARAGKGAHQTWQTTSSLNIGRYGLASARHGDRLYAFGGITGTEYLDSIEMGVLDKDGGLSAWTQTTPMSVPRASFAAVSWKDWVYLVGGTNRDGYFSAVEYAAINERGEIGYFGSEGEKQAYEQARQARLQQKAQLPNQGEVLEILNTSGYSYIRVLNPARGEVWLAGSKMQGLEPGAVIAYSTGVEMSNFYSKELKRAFPSVLFVGTIEVR